MPLPRPSLPVSELTPVSVPELLGMALGASVPVPVVDIVSVPLLFVVLLSVLPDELLWAHAAPLAPPTRINALAIRSEMRVIRPSLSHASEIRFRNATRSRNAAPCVSVQLGDATGGGKAGSSGKIEGTAYRPSTLGGAMLSGRLKQAGVSGC
jgi:hypothetical protein